MNIEIREGEANRAIRLLLYIVERLVDMETRAAPVDERASSGEAWSVAQPPEAFVCACTSTFELIHGASQTSAAKLTAAVRRAEKWMSDAGVVMEEENAELLAQVGARLDEINTTPAPVPVTGPIFIDPGTTGTSPAGGGGRSRTA